MKQSKIPVALSGLHLSTVLKPSSSDVKRRHVIVDDDDININDNDDDDKKEQGKKTTSKKSTPPPPSRKKRAGGSLSSTGLRVLKVSSKQMGKIQVLETSRTGKWFAKFVRVTFDSGDISLISSINQSYSNMVRENKI